MATLDTPAIAASLERNGRARLAAASTALLVVAALVAGPTLGHAEGSYAHEGGIAGFFHRLFSPPAPIAIVHQTDEAAHPLARTGVRQTRRARPSGPRSASGTASAGRTLCVRTCDGFAFPVGRLARRSDLPVHEAACQAACPGAETQLYTMSRGVTEEDPARARSVRDGSLYARLATAFLYRNKLAGACSCQGPNNIATPIPIAQDRTLRAGDVVVDDRGRAKVFDGTGGAPHPPAAFAEFRRSHAIGAAAKRQVDALMGVSRREATAREFQRSLRVRQAGLEAVSAPAGSASGVQAFRVVTASAGFAQVNVRQVAPMLIVVR